MKITKLDRRSQFPGQIPVNVLTAGKIEQSETKLLPTVSKFFLIKNSHRGKSPNINNSSGKIPAHSILYIIPIIPNKFYIQTVIKLHNIQFFPKWL